MRDNEDLKLQVRKLTGVIESYRKMMSERILENMAQNPHYQGRHSGMVMTPGVGRVGSVTSVSPRMQGGGEIGSLKASELTTKTNNFSALFPH